MSDWSSDVCSSDLVKGLGAAKTAVLKIPWSICYLAITLGAVLMIYEFLKVMKERILEEPAEE